MMVVVVVLVVMVMATVMMASNQYYILHFRRILNPWALVKSFPAAQRELGELKTFAASQGFTDEIALWDVAFWSERLREKVKQQQQYIILILADACASYFILRAVLRAVIYS